ncbi:MAG: LLM class flavin-dependent oxidoreductase [Candidatus Thorarchaeota archaeon]|jgi:alkanesulfonate monooxygenase SsuD/methylene tetrahydromethanopterin reductase-like flavin-dependent oxidoreductase (luciferase family)
MSSGLKFGVILIQNCPYSEIAQVATRIEKTGWDSIWVADEFNIALECWTTLSALANVTSSIRIGPLISAIPIRHPALLAKTAATVDNISNGRLELGIGSGVPGTIDPIYRMTGIKDWKASERVSRFREQVEILDLLLREENVDYSGEYYKFDGCKLTPRPKQKPRPPITIGAHGPKMLRIAARYADRWNTHGETDMELDDSLKTIKNRIPLFDEICDEVGRRNDEVLKSVLTCGPWDTVPFSSIDTFEEITNRFRDIGVQEIIYYYPFWDNAKKPVFDEVDSDVLSRLR